MALQATPYKITLDISDTDRGVYESVKFTVARHPSETEIRLASRILAYAIFYHPQLAFGRGLSDSDEAALWEIDLTGEIQHWIDVGQPDAERVIKASRRAPQMSVVVYGNARLWREKTILQFGHLDNVRVLALAQEELAIIAAKLTRSTHWGVMISDAQLYISDGDQQMPLPLECWHGELPTAP
ncbi:YaeQ family protein [Pseudidiomarina donghaiensis]|uniref:YaeQ family protein n=1 Tax=Pseudidiomarina donghaiensis TaxID=519452 RepID=A0A432XFS4_9GAMM|nr:YaeQ family protein [Pseudidiomarina donghaiensis]RUO47456.1 hypothetical protein CWE24_09065 [Pseudidiomarina donghaiensis]SFV23050.1 Uncharacterized conserved protein YaeQ, suppresses RfaH defect [Pseudidiomarina donghaiensis]